MNNLKFSNALLIVFLVLFSCSRANDEARIEVDFLINDEELESLGFEYDEDDLSLYKNDPDKVYFATINEEVVFKDITVPVADNKRKWYLDNEEWKAEKLETVNVPTFSHTFETPGLYRVKLVVNDHQKVTKFVRVLDKSINAKLVDLKTPKNSVNSDGESTDIGDFEVFDFKVSNSSPEKWEAIVFEDISQTETKITKRLWDFGDGTIIPTKGPKVKYSYARTGVYDVKMCVNMTNNCKRKRIVVDGATSSTPAILAKAPNNQSKSRKTNKAKQRAKSKTFSNPENSGNSASPSEIQEATVKKSAPPSSSEIVLQNLGFEMPAKIQAGLPVRMKDLSFPEEAVQSRSWFIDGVKQYFHQRTVNYIFDAPGTYEIKMCLNKKRDQCVIKKINVYQNQVVAIAEAPKPVKKKAKSKENSKSFKEEISYIPIVSKPSIGFMCQSYGKAGMKAKYKCTTTKDFYYGNAIVNIEPNIDIELQNAEIYGDTDGYMDVLLLDDTFTELGRIKNVQVLPGYSTIEFADLAFTLEKNKKYSILLKPKSTRSKKIGLENADSCSVPAYNNADLKVEYQGKAYVLYDIKYCY